MGKYAGYMGDFRVPRNIFMILDSIDDTFNDDSISPKNLDIGTI